MANITANIDQGFGPQQTISPVNSINTTVLESKTTLLAINMQVTATSEFTDLIKLVPVPVFTYALTDNAPITVGTGGGSGPANTETWFMG